MSVHYKYAYYDSTGNRRVKTFTASTLTKAKKLAKTWERTRPDIYVLHRGGWASDNVMKKVYRQVIPEEDKKQTELIVNHFSKFS